jgi:magnesium-transporting ATPase (P-type)
LSSTNGKEKTDINQLLKELSTSRKGLSSSQVESRLQQYGANELPEKKS